MRSMIQGEAYAEITQPSDQNGSLKFPKQPMPVHMFRVDPGEEYLKKVIVKGICHSEGNKIMLASTQNRKGKRTCRFAIPQLVDD